MECDKLIDQLLDVAAAPQHAVPSSVNAISQSDNNTHATDSINKVNGGGGGKQKKRERLDALVAGGGGACQTIPGL